MLHHFQKRVLAIEIANVWIRANGNRFASASGLRATSDGNTFRLVMERRAFLADFFAAGIPEESTDAFTRKRDAAELVILSTNGRFERAAFLRNVLQFFDIRIVRAHLTSLNILFFQSIDFGQAVHYVLARRHANGMVKAGDILAKVMLTARESGLQFRIPGLF